MSASEVLDLHRLRCLLDAGGPREGLRYLNARAPHRCSAIYCFDGPALRNLYTYDRRGEIGVVPRPLPLVDGFCPHVRLVRRPSQAAEACTAGRAAVDLQTVPPAAPSYHGLPLSRGPGDLFGVFCHFDFVPLTLPEREWAFLRRAVYVLQEHLTVQPACHRYRQ